MAIHTQQSISGFIATDPQLTTTENGDARFYARFGQENYRREEDGSFTKLEPSFSNLVLLKDYVKDMQAISHDYVLMGLELKTDEEYAGVG